MVPVVSLWLPILLSAVIVFFASFIIHSFMRYHGGDYRQVPNEDRVMEALRSFDIPAGDYMMPRPADMKQMRSPEYIEKRTKGPVLTMTVMRKGEFGMGRQLLQWFLYCVVVGVIAAYVAGRTLGPGSTYLHVFRIAGATAFIAHSVAKWQDPIWYQRSWSTAARYTLDGLIYGLLTAGTFGWLWPR